MRRIITVLCICLALCLATFFGSAGTALAEQASGYTGDLSQYGAVLLIDADSGSVLVSYNENEKVEMASTTKIMTCLLALENTGLDDEVEISQKAAGASGQSLDLAKGETVKMRDLLNAMMMFSGNDAATAIAEHVGGGDVSKFVDMMNAKASALGMEGTHFANPSGLHDDNHFTTASDMAKLTQAAMKNTDFANIVKQTSYTMPASNIRPEKTYKNTNYLMREDMPDYYYSYATGVKTGDTTQAGKCLVATATRANMNLICLIFKDTSKDGEKRWSGAKSLFDYGFENYETVDVQTLLDKAPAVQTQIENFASTDESDGLLTFEAPSSPGTLATLKKATVDGILNGTDTIEADPEYSRDLKAPILKDDVLGTVTYKSAATGDILYTGNLIATRDVQEAGAEPDASGGTAVSVMPAVNIEDLNKHDGDIFYWLIPPGILIAVLVWRLMTVQRRKRKRFSKKRPHYSYRIK